MTLWPALFGKKREAVAEVRRHFNEAQAAFAKSLTALREAGKENQRGGWEDEFMGGHPPEGWEDAAQEAWWEAQRALRKRRGDK